MARALPAAAAEAPGPSATRSCAATWARRPTTIRAKRPQRRRAARLGGAARAPGRAIKAHDAGDAPGAARAARGSVDAPPAATCTGRATRPRRTRSWPRSRGARRDARWSRSSRIATDEIGLNEALAARGISAIETDLAELIVQLAGRRPSHILVPAIHKNRAEIRELFGRTMRRPREPRARRRPSWPRPPGGTCARFLRRPVAVAGANFAVAETGTVGVVESEGNGRMCTTLPEVLVTVMGIEKVLPRWRDLEVFLQLLPRSSTGERMNPYTSLWTGVHAGRRAAGVPPGPARQRAARECWPTRSAAQALRCIRCSACLNVCPVYSRIGGHAYESVYPGPIGAILTPQLLDEAPTRCRSPRACAAPATRSARSRSTSRVLVDLRARVVEGGRAGRRSLAGRTADPPDGGGRVRSSPTSVGTRRRSGCAPRADAVRPARRAPFAARAARGMERRPRLAGGASAIVPSLVAGACGGGRAAAATAGGRRWLRRLGRRCSRPSPAIDDVRDADPAAAYAALARGYRARGAIGEVAGSSC